MLTIEEIKAIVKKEFGLNLEDTGRCYVTKNNTVYVAEGRSYDVWVVSFEKTTKGNVVLELTSHQLATEKELKSLIRKFKKLRKLI